MSSNGTPRLNEAQIAALDGFAYEAGLTRGGKFVIDGAPYPLADDDPDGPLEIWLRNVAGATACIHVTRDGQLVEV